MEVFPRLLFIDCTDFFLLLSCCYQESKMCLRFPGITPSFLPRISTEIPGNILTIRLWIYSGSSSCDVVGVFLGIPTKKAYGITCKTHPEKYLKEKPRKSWKAILGNLPWLPPEITFGELWKTLLEKLWNNTRITLEGIPRVNHVVTPSKPASEILGRTRVGFQGQLVHVAEGTPENSRTNSGSKFEKTSESWNFPDEVLEEELCKKLRKNLNTGQL